MTGEAHAHSVSISLVKAVQAEFDAGTNIALKVNLSCPSSCDLRGNIVNIIAQDVVVKEIELTEFDGMANETEEFVMKAPIRLGRYTWTAAFPAQKKRGLLHGESSAPFSFIVKPHATSITVWDIPCPIVLNTKFELKVGVNCSAECELTGKKIEIHDQEGGKLANEKLGGVPWPATSALYWANVELKAPSIKGYYRWTAMFSKPDLALPHDGTFCTFGFATASPPENMVTIEVIDKNTKTAIRNARVFLCSHGDYPYRNLTDDCGVARVSVPKGEYSICVSKDEYETFEITAKISRDIAIKVGLLVEFHRQR